MEVLCLSIFKIILYVYNKMLIIVVAKHYVVVKITIFDMDTWTNEWNNMLDWLGPLTSHSLSLHKFVDTLNKADKLGG